MFLANSPPQLAQPQGETDAAKKRGPKWSHEETNKLLEIASHHSDPKMALLELQKELPGRTPSAISSKLSSIRTGGRKRKVADMMSTNTAPNGSNLIYLVKLILFSFFFLLYI